MQSNVPEMINMITEGIQSRHVEAKESLDVITFHNRKCSHTRNARSWAMGI